LPPPPPRNFAVCAGDNIWCMRFLCWIPKDTDTNSQYVRGIVRSLQQWLR
jgi:hypothetical protein